MDKYNDIQAIHNKNETDDILPVQSEEGNDSLEKTLTMKSIRN
jgi:hypothetical protein